MVMIPTFIHLAERFWLTFIFVLGVEMYSIFLVIDHLHFPHYTQLCLVENHYLSRHIYSLHT